MEHWENCDAPICQDEKAYAENPDWKKTVAWYPGEAVCGKTPYDKFQKRQAKINRWHEKGLFRHPKGFFTVESLENGAVLTKGRAGKNPDDTTFSLRSASTAHKPAHSIAK